MRKSYKIKNDKISRVYEGSKEIFFLREHNQEMMERDIPPFQMSLEKVNNGIETLVFWLGKMSKLAYRGVQIWKIQRVWKVTKMRIIRVKRLDMDYSSNRVLIGQFRLKYIRKRK